MNQREYAKKLANDHWSYIERLLETHGEDANSIELIKFHYISAFLHGFKHAKTYYQNKTKSELLCRKLLNAVERYENESRKSEIMVK